MLMRDFKEFAELLNSNRVEYLIVRSCATVVRDAAAKLKLAPERIDVLARGGG